ncbi:MAG: SPOR domain-containing protein [Gemmatimonadetes bacterium]|nr:SPOR domain-containing protein [Gemmatimonadota bacterium]
MIPVARPVVPSGGLRAMAVRRAHRAFVGATLVAGFLATASVPAGADIASAEIAWETGDRRAAAELIRSHVRNVPSDARTPRVLALLARTAGNPSEALGRWDEVLAIEPKGTLAAEAHWVKGMHAYSAGLYISAVREFGTLAEDFDGDFDEGRAHLWKGLAQLGADAPAAAQESFDRARRQATAEEDRVMAELGMAHAAFTAGDLEDALSRYRSFEADHPEDGRASAAARRAAECLRRLGRSDEATQEAVRIERDYPNTVEGTLARADSRREEAPVAPEAEAPAVETRGPFIVQVASMAELRNAVSLRRAIRGIGIDGVRIELSEARSGPVHRVILGPYASEIQAHALADSVAALGDLNPRVREVSE